MLGGVFFLLPIELQQVSRLQPDAGRRVPAPGDRADVPALIAVGSAVGTHRAAAADVGRPTADGARVWRSMRASMHPATTSSRCCRRCCSSGSGCPSSVAPLTATALSSAPPERTGLASAVNNTVARTGSLLAVAILPALAGITGDSYLHPAVFESGFQRAALIAAVVCAGAGALCGGDDSQSEDAAGGAIRCWTATTTAISMRHRCARKRSTARRSRLADRFSVTQQRQAGLRAGMWLA